MANPNERLSRTQALILLLLIAVVSVGTHLALLPAHPVSVCFHDELHYFQQARDLAHGHVPHHNRVFQAKYPPLYGLSLAPAWWIGGPRGFPWWSRVLNALILTSALLPAYLLARRFLSRAAAVPTAALLLLTPLHAYVPFLLSEILLFPLTLWLAVAFFRLVERPGAGRALVAGVVLGLTILTKLVMAAAAPALALALVLALRSWTRALKLTVGLALGAALLVLPWVFRDYLLASEANIAILYSYQGEYLHAGQVPLGVYLHYLRAEPALAVVGLGLPVLLLALSGLLAHTTEASSSRRGYAGLVLFASLFLSITVALWIARAVSYAADYHERYFLSLWPLFLLAFVDQVAHPSRRALPFATAALVACALLLMVPDAVLDPASLGSRFSTIDAPSTPGLLGLIRWARVDPTTARGLLAAPALLVPLLLFVFHRRLIARRLIAAVLLAVATLYLGLATYAAVGKTRTMERDARAERQATDAWLEQEMQPGDALVHHTFLDSLAFHHAIHFNQDLLVIEEDLTPHWESGLSFDRKTGRYTMAAGNPSGRLLLLTRTPGPVGPGVVSARGNFRLLDLSRGLRSLGAWLSPPPGLPRYNAIDEERWCLPGARISLPVAYPGRYEASLVLHHPADSPLQGPVSLRIRGPGGALKWITLKPGEQATVPWQGMVWSPQFWLEIESDRYSEQDGPRRGVRIKGLMVRPAARDEVSEEARQ